MTFSRSHASGLRSGALPYEEADLEQVRKLEDFEGLRNSM